jgi:hypothetical protein
MVHAQSGTTEVHRDMQAPGQRRALGGEQHGDCREARVNAHRSGRCGLQLVSDRSALCRAHLSRVPRSGKHCANGHTIGRGQIERDQRGQNARSVAVGRVRLEHGLQTADCECDLRVVVVGRVPERGQVRLCAAGHATCRISLAGGAFCSHTTEAQSSPVPSRVVTIGTDFSAEQSSRDTCCSRAATRRSSGRATKSTAQPSTASTTAHNASCLAPLARAAHTLHEPTLCRGPAPRDGDVREGRVGLGHHGGAQQRPAHVEGRRRRVRRQGERHAPDPHSDHNLCALVIAMSQCGREAGPP